MRTLLMIIAFLVASFGFAQDESCLFSDGNYHYQIQINGGQIPPPDFDKVDFINFMEFETDISVSESTFLNVHILELFRQYRNEVVDPFNHMMYVISDVDSLQSIFNLYPDTIVYSSKYCDCMDTQGYYFNYAKLIIDEAPANDFDKIDFIEHLQLNSNISDDDASFLNSTIFEVYRTFPSSQNANVQRVVSIISNTDLLFNFLYEFTESVEYSELICEEIVLTVEDSDISDTIRVIPNPVTQESIIYLKKSEYENLTIIDVTGKMIATKNILNLNEIQLAQFYLDRGFYFLKFTKSSWSVTKKIVVN